MSGRRDFLRGLVSLPMIGGAVTLIGRPTAVAEPATAEMLATYGDWLFYERRVLMAEMSGYVPSEARRLQGFVGNRSDDFHFPSDGGTNWKTIIPPSARAAIVLSTAGCDWRV